MVLEYLPRIVFFHDGSDAESDSGCPAASPLPKPKPASRPQSLLAPVARFLRDSVDAVNNVVLQARDGLTEEQRAAARRLRERRQIVQLRLENVGQEIILRKYINAPLCARHVD
jgi:hypothetical protein